MNELETSELGVRNLSDLKPSYFGTGLPDSGTQFFMTRDLSEGIFLSLSSTMSIILVMSHETFAVDEICSAGRSPDVTSIK